MPAPANLPYFVDPDDPRAPAQEVWDRMSEEERARVVDSLPSEFPVSEAMPPEGDAHYNSQADARSTLGKYFERIGRKIYFACNLPVYYPGEAMFAPDIIAVLDVERHERMRWVVAKEGKGLDLAIEIHVAGDRRKDLERNVERYARLGIREYFIFDRGSLRLAGYRLDESTGAYRRLVPQGGLYSSAVLGLELCIEGTRLRFYRDSSPVLGMEELVGQFQAIADQAQLLREEAERKLAEEARLRQEAETKLSEEARLRQEEARLRQEAEQKLAEALALLESLRRP